MGVKVVDSGSRFAGGVSGRGSAGRRLSERLGFKAAGDRTAPDGGLRSGSWSGRHNAEQRPLAQKRGRTTHAEVNTEGRWTVNSITGHLALDRVARITGGFYLDPLAEGTRR